MEWTTAIWGRMSEEQEGTLVQEAAAGKVRSIGDALTLAASSRRLPNQIKFEVRFNGERIGVVPLREMLHHVELLIPGRLIKTEINRLDLEVQGMSIPKPKPQRLMNYRRFCTSFANR